MESLAQQSLSFISTNFNDYFSSDSGLFEMAPFDHMWLWSNRGFVLFY